jgi:TPR repeat protein
MSAKNLAIFLLGIVLISSTFAEDTTTTSPGRFLRKEPADKTIWYGGLVAKMIFFYGQACASGESEGCFNLAAIYDHGDASVKNKTKAIDYYKKACGSGFSLACNNLGILYAEGDGVEKDIKAALTYFDKSCQLQEEIACKNKATAIEWVQQK